MSLINKMLRDLDARRAAPGERMALPAAITPLAARQEAPRGPGLGLVVAVVLALLLAAGGWWGWQKMRAPATAPAPTPAPVLAAVPAAVSPAPTLPARPAKPLAVTPPARPAPAVAAPPVPPRQSVAPPPAAVPPALPAIAAASPAPMPKPAQAAQAVQAPQKPVQALPREVPALADVMPSVEKQLRIPTAAERAEAEFRRALVMQRQGLLNEAVAHYQAALVDRPDHAQARQALASLLVESRRFDDAEAVLRKGVELPAVRLASVLALARLMVERGKSPAALEVLLGHAGAGERSADFQGFAATLLNREGRRAEAIDRYSAAIRLAPNEARWWVGLGIVLDAEGRAAEAREAYQKARSLPGLSTDLALHIDQRLR